VCGQHHAPAAFTPGKGPVPIVQEAGWALELVWIGAENLALPGFDPRTFQPIASRYTDYAIPAPNALSATVNLKPLHLWQQLELKLQYYCSFKLYL
jgi:hypothetical protein